MTKTDAQPAKKAGIRKTVKKVMDNYENTEVRVLKNHEWELMAVVSMHGIELELNEDLISNLEAVDKTFQSLDDIIFVGAYNEMSKEQLVKRCYEVSKLKMMSWDFVEIFKSNPKNLKTFLVALYLP